MGALQALQFDLARRPEPDSGQSVHGVVNRLADQDLAAFGKPSHPRRHGDVAPEQIVATSHRRAHVHSHSHPDLIPTLGVVVKRMLYRDAAANGLPGICEGDHEPVALGLDDVTTVVVGVLVEAQTTTGFNVGSRPQRISSLASMDGAAQPTHSSHRPQP
jgi:hypothetical protein